MNFEQLMRVKKLGEIIGNAFAYFLFTTILFFILLLLNRIPASWSYFHIMAITFLIALMGAFVKRILK